MPLRSSKICAPLLWNRDPNGCGFCTDAGAETGGNPSPVGDFFFSWTGGMKMTQIHQKKEDYGEVLSYQTKRLVLKIPFVGQILQVILVSSHLAMEQLEG